MALATGTLIPHVANAALIFVLLTILATFLMNKTLLGRYALAIGSNEEATRLSGVNVRLWKIIIYVVAGVFMAIGAVLYSARLGLVQPAEGVGMELTLSPQPSSVAPPSRVVAPRSPAPWSVRSCMEPSRRA